jgi:hypothetical protein
MKKLLPLFLVLLSACSTVEDPNIEHGRDGTIAYHVDIETSEPGARVELDNESVGVSPLSLKIFGDRDGTFHNFSGPFCVIRVYPVRPGQYVQTKRFLTGGFFASQDRIPSKLYFDLSLQPGPTDHIDIHQNVIVR